MTTTSETWMGAKIVCVISIIVMIAVISSPASADQITISANGSTLDVELADSEAARELAAMLAKGAITIDMIDYGDMEKYGTLPSPLPRSDARINAVPGDVMLYQGGMIVVFYGTNSYTYTRIGRIAGATRESILAALGEGDVTATLSLK